MAQEFYGYGEGEKDRIVISDAIVFDRREHVVYLSKPRLVPEDIVAFRFAHVLEEAGVEYVVVAGYVAILFGRARRNDEIGFILGSLSEDGFVRLCTVAREAGFAVMQGDIGSEESVRRLYREYLAQGYGVRFTYRDMIIPNIEAKLARTDPHRYAITNHVRVVVNGEHVLRASPIELQIAYKLYLGSDKDVGDAVFLHSIFKDAISPDELHKWCEKLGADHSILKEGEP